MSLREIFIKLNLFGLSICLSLLIIESILRWLDPPPTKYYVWRPDIHEIFHPDPAIFPDIQGEGRFITNAEGMRSEPIPPEPAYHILTVGGRTTEGLYLDHTETWPYLLQQALNQQQAQSVWIGNVGKSGKTTRYHILQIRELLSQYSEIDMLILLAGVNDFTMRLARDRAYDAHFMNRPDMESDSYLKHFRFFLLIGYPFPKIHAYGT